MIENLCCRKNFEVIEKADEEILEETIDLNMEEKVEKPAKMFKPRFRCTKEVNKKCPCLKIESFHQCSCDENDILGDN